MTMDIVPFPPVTPSDAVAAGYAEFNYQPHLCIDVPDGGRDLPTFDVLLFGQTRPVGSGHDNSFQYDSRKQDYKPGIVCVLMDGRG